MTKINLLVIDDDDINLFIMRKTIEKTGYDVEMVSQTDGKMAVDYLNELKINNKPFPNLIFVDVNMPVMNGWEFLEVYEGQYTDTQINMYMLSSSVYEVDLQKAKTFKSIRGFISKPLYVQQLSEIFEETLASSVS
jgi:CheY-like chemotaxis protein